MFTKAQCENAAECDQLGLGIGKGGATRTGRSSKHQMLTKLHAKFEDIGHTLVMVFSTAN